MLTNGTLFVILHVSLLKQHAIKLTIENIALFCMTNKYIDCET